MGSLLFYVLSASVWPDEGQQTRHGGKNPSLNIKVPGIDLTELESLFNPFFGIFSE